MSLQILTKCNAGAIWGTGLGGLSEYPVGVVAASLGLRNAHGVRLSEGGVIVARALMGLCDRAWGDLERKLALEFAFRFQAGRWRLNRKRGENQTAAELCCRVGTLAVLQYRGGFHCTSCTGLTLKARAECKRCRGTGKGEFPEYFKADMLKMHQDNYAKTWANRVQDIIAIPQSWESEAARHVRWQLEIGAVDI